MNCGSRHIDMETMDSRHISALMAGNTALLSQLCEFLIEKGIIDRTELRDRLYNLLTEANIHGAAAGAATKHLIAIIESGDENVRLEQ